MHKSCLNRFFIFVVIVIALFVFIFRVVNLNVTFFNVFVVFHSTESDTILMYVLVS